MEILHTQLRLEKDVWKKIKHAAVEEGVSANRMAVILLKEALSARHNRLVDNADKH